MTLDIERQCTGADATEFQMLPKTLNAKGRPTPRSVSSIKQHKWKGKRATLAQQTATRQSQTKRSQKEKRTKNNTDNKSQQKHNLGTLGNVSNTYKILGDNLFCARETLSPGSAVVHKHVFRTSNSTTHQNRI